MKGALNLKPGMLRLQCWTPRFDSLKERTINAKSSILVEGGEEMYEIKIILENIPQFCKACSAVGHAHADCRLIIKSKEENKGKAYEDSAGNEDKGPSEGGGDGGEVQPESANKEGVEEVEVPSVVPQDLLLEGAALAPPEGKNDYRAQDISGRVMVYGSSPNVAGQNLGSESTASTTRTSSGNGSNRVHELVKIIYEGIENPGLALCLL